MFVLGSKQGDFECPWMARYGVRRRLRKEKVASLRRAVNFTTMAGKECTQQEQR